VFSCGYPLNQLLKAKENKLYLSSHAETCAQVIYPYFGPHPLHCVLLFNLIAQLPKPSPHTPICYCVSISLSVQPLRWLTEDLGILEEMQFIKGATVFFLNDSLFTNMPSTLATSGLINSKGNKISLYLHRTDAFLSIK